MATKTKSGQPPIGGGKRSGGSLTPEERKTFNEMTNGMKIELHAGGNSDVKSQANGPKAGGKTSSTTQTKGGGASYANSSNFQPARSTTPSSANAGGINNSPMGSPVQNPVPQTPGGYDNNVNGDLKRLEGQQNAQKLSEYDDKAPRQNANDEDAKASGEKGSRLKNARAAKNAEEAAAIPGLGQQSGNTPLYSGQPSQSNNFKTKAIKYIKKKKWKFIAGGVGVGGAIFIVLLILFLFGTLLIPHFVSNVVGWQFVRVTRSAYESASSVAEEQMDVAGMNDGAYDAASAKYKGDQTFEDIKDLDPPAMNKVAQNMDHNTEFAETSVKDKVLGRNRLTSIKFFDSDSNSFITRKFTATNFTGTIQDSPIFKRAVTAKNIIKSVGDMLDITNPYTAAGPVYASPEVSDDVIGTEDGFNRAGEDPNIFNDQKPDAINEAALEDDAFNKVKDTSAIGTSNDEQVNESEQNAESQLETDMQNPAQVAQVVSESGNLPNDVIQTINSSFVQDALDKVASEIGDLLNPLSGKLVAVCIVDEGSKVSGPTAQAQSTEVQRNAVLTMAVADQQKRGSPYVNSSMVGAWNWKLNGDNRSGGVSDSIPIERASGEKVTTQSQLSTEGAPFGNLANTGNVLAALGIPFSGPLQSAMDSICPAVTNIWVNLGLGVVNLTLTLILSIFTGGGEGALEEGATIATEEAAEAATENVVEDVVADFTTNQTSSGFDMVKDFGKDTIKQGGIIAGVTFLAKFLVLSQMGTLYNGMATGPQFDNSVDEGTNQLTNAIVGHAYGGRPLTNTEAMEVQQDDNTTLADFNQSQSAYQRYLAFSNPQSLASVLTDRVATNLNYGFFSSMLADIGNIFNPARLMPQILFGGVSSQANAASNIDTVDYGDVQQGYSDAEYSIIANTDSYKSPSENEYILDNSGNKDTIAQTYGPCFDESVATLLTTTTDGTPDIVRDATGNVSQTEGLCSPQNLGPDNPTYGDLVFRYRLALSYNTTIGILQGIANAD